MTNPSSCWKLIRCRSKNSLIIDFKKKSLWFIRILGHKRAAKAPRFWSWGKLHGDEQVQYTRGTPYLGSWTATAWMMAENGWAGRKEGNMNPCWQQMINWSHPLSWSKVLPAEFMHRDEPGTEMSLREHSLKVVFLLLLLLQCTVCHVQIEICILSSATLKI